ncbi:hypothetical protein D3Z53_07345 [Lachnospiraceae bacterium]|nr:hypothetical protein [Lachnospiraceae bacterium]
MINSRKVFNRIVFEIPLCMCVLFALYSPFMVYQYSTFITILLLFLWLIIALMDKKKWTSKEIYSIPLYVYLVVMPCIMGYSFISNRYLILVVFLLGSLISSYCEYVDMWNDIGKMLKIVSPFLIYVYLKTFIALLNNPYASRKIKTTGDYTLLARGQGIGGYEFIYFLSLLSNICIGLFFQLKNKKHKAVCLIIAILSYIEIILSNYMTALMISIIGFILTIMVLLVKKNKIWMLFLSFGMVIFLLFGNDIMKIVLENFLKIIPQNGKTFMRLYEMKDYFIQNVFISFFEDRFFTINQSLNCLLKYPFLGIIGQLDLGREMLLSNVGQHSFFLDTFAFYGFGIGIYNIVNYFSLFKRQFFDKHCLIITIPTMFCGFVLLLFNNLTISIGICLSIIYPYSLYLLKKQNKKYDYINKYAVKAAEAVESEN